MIRRGPTVVLAALLLALAATPANAAGWKWVSKGSIRGVPGSADSVTCPTTSLCVMAIGGNKIAWTTNPRGPARAWKKTAIAPASDQIGAIDIFQVDCPTATFCIAGDTHSRVITTTAPTGPAAGWVHRELPSDTYVGVESLACASPKLCGILDVSGYALISTDGGAVWNRSRLLVDASSTIRDITCAPGICAAAQPNARLYHTTTPRAVPAGWKSTRFKGSSAFVAVECASKSLCVAARGYNGAVYASTNPAGGTAAWKKVGSAGAAHLYCQSGALCFSLGGDLRWSTKPARKGSWKLALDTNGPILSSMSCPTARMCVLTDIGGKVWVGTR